MKKTVLVVLTLLCCLCIFTACHECEWATEWAYDVQYHWHECIADDECEEINDKAEHSLVIKYSADGSKQWQECECGYKSAEADHTHIGGNASCTAKAICTACGQSYGEVLGHSYGNTSYVWAEDNATCTATRVCANDETHVETETVNATSEVTQVQSATTVEITTYTATFTNSWATTQTKAVQTKDVVGVAKVTNAEGTTGYETFALAMGAVKDGDTVTILVDGTYVLPTINQINTSSKSLSFVGSKNVIIDISAGTVASGATISFEGVTVKFSDTINYKGITHAQKVSYKDCHLLGKQFMYAPTVEFTNCTFENKQDYCVWTYGATSATFTDCTFNTGGKAILVYIEAEIHATINVNNCVFNDDDTLDTVKGAIEVGSSPNSTDTTYNIVITDCTVNGFAENDEGIATNSTLFGNKNSMDKDHLNVIIDDVDVY